MRPGPSRTAAARGRTQPQCRTEVIRRSSTDRPALRGRHCSRLARVSHSERRLGARLSRAQNVVGYVAVPVQRTVRRAVFLYIAAFFEDALFCREEVRLVRGQQISSCFLAGPDGR